jgi:translation initiation factor IF-2
MLKPTIEEQDTARIEVREVFRVPKIGAVAGCYVTDGEITRDDQVRIVRDGTIIFDGKLASLRRFKEDVRSVRSGYECGIGIEGFQDIKEGDVIESYKTVEVAREA